MNPFSSINADTESAAASVCRISLRGLTAAGTVFTAGCFAAGSGTDVSQVNRLLKQHKQMKDMMKQMKNFGKKGGKRRMPFFPGMPGMPKM